jgi:hypothetical protein
VLLEEDTDHDAVRLLTIPSAGVNGQPAAVRQRLLPGFGWSVAPYAAALDPLAAPVDPARLTPAPTPRACS